ncbi:universal stress protein [Thermomonas paludicola]|uniref:universal stress protein n=1 Tax=Thermomonas paludicola TaxID=2884874 RepID=UPI002113B17B|nr:universal stress protein [Thermomonas paludicola]
MTIRPKPASILLATDLSARSDRAQARAIQLARHWQSRLVVVVAQSEEASFSLPSAYHDADAPQDAPAPETPAAYLERIARRELADAGVAVEIRVVTGAPGPVAAAAAADAGCGLIITGTSRSDAVMRMEPGSTLRWLARHAGRPVLAVHDRVRGAYRQVTVASDYSAAATAALQLAANWFDDAASRILLHGYPVPLATLALNDGLRADALAVLQASADREARDALAHALGDAATGWASLAQAGGPVRLLREHARTASTELTVIASHGRTALLDRLMGSVAERLLETVGTDLLVVPLAR